MGTHAYMRATISTVQCGSQGLVTTLLIFSSAQLSWQCSLNTGDKSPASPSPHTTAKKTEHATNETDLLLWKQTVFSCLISWHHFLIKLTNQVPVHTAKAYQIACTFKCVQFQVGAIWSKVDYSLRSDWTIRHSLMLKWLKMSATKIVKIQDVGSWVVTF